MGWDGAVSADPSEPVSSNLRRKVSQLMLAATGSMHVDWWSFLIGVTVNEEENCYGITIIEYFTGSQSDCF